MSVLVVFSKQLVVKIFVRQVFLAVAHKVLLALLVSKGDLILLAPCPVEEACKALLVVDDDARR